MSDNYDVMDTYCKLSNVFLICGSVPVEWHFPSTVFWNLRMMYYKTQHEIVKFRTDICPLMSGGTWGAKLRDLELYDYIWMLLLHALHYLLLNI